MKPAVQKMLRGHVIDGRQITPNMWRLTIGGGELDELHPMGFDQWFRFFFPRDGQGEFRLPGRGDLLGYAQFLATPRSIRPHMRSYTVRELRRPPTGTQIDIDIVLHDGGIGSSWAQAAQPGTQIALLDEGIGFAPPADADRFLLVGDETALPAIAGICASLPDAARGVAVIEVPDLADRQEFTAPPGIDIRWLPRAPGQRPGVTALHHVHDDAEFAPAGVYAYTAGESALATGTRRYLTATRGIPKDQVAFCGYWRLPTRAVG
ncbi:siderophore-interacting protein [Microbacterium sp.]|uniref:siderophore-interacting protein n=1 Tax=Microbacterium sp. TaxID=51671 RepID=UPI003C73C2B8